MLSPRQSVHPSIQNAYRPVKPSDAKNICLEEIAQHKQDLELAATEQEKECLQSELEYWQEELTKYDSI